MIPQEIIRSNSTSDSLSQVELFWQEHPLLVDTNWLEEKEVREITETFLQQTSVDILPHINIAGQLEWVIYLLLFFLSGMAVVWYYVPERLIPIFTFMEKSESLQTRERNVASPGLLIRFFFFLNYLFAMGIFIFLFIEQMIPATIVNSNQTSVLIYVGLSILVLFLFRNVFIIVIGFMFKTGSLAGKQMYFYLNIDNALGVLLIPILIFILFIQNDIFIYFGLILIIIAHVFRWLQTFLMGKSYSGYSVLHLFMYLCTLEIIPLLVLVKLLQNGVF